MPVRIFRPAVFLGLIFAVSSVSAQKPASPPPKSETIELSPFEVTTNAVNGYVASETMTGSRVKTQIVDLPYSVNVMTNEFLEDFGIFELSDNLTQISGFTGLDVGGNFVLRGFTSSNQLRDGFFRLGRYGSSNIDRIEVIKGSSAAIYGRTSPGGMINLISKQPKAAAYQKFSVNAGDFDTRRYTLEAAGPLFQQQLGRTNYILTLGTFDRGYDDGYATTKNKEYYAAADHVFANGSKLFLSYEYFSQDRKSPISSAPLVIDQKGTAATTDDVAVGYALNLGKVNAYGPNSQLNRGNTSVTGIYELKMNEIFSARVSGNVYAARRDDYNQNTGWGTININPAVAAAPFSLRGATPNWGRIDEDGGAFQGDVLAHYWTNDRKIEHSTLATIDVNVYHRWDPTLSYGAATNPDLIAWSTARRVTLDANLNPVGDIAYFPKWHDPSSGFVSTRKMQRRTFAGGGLLRHQAAFFQGRLLAYTGARFDIIHYRHHDYLTAASQFTPFIPNYKLGDLVEKKITQVKPNLGLNYKVKENFRIYGNYSESYFIAQGDNPIDIADPAYKSEIASGWDYGFKGSLLGDRINYTLCGFYITRENVSVNDLVETPVGSGNFVQVTRRDGNQLVRGYEADLNWLISSEWSFLFSYGRVNSIYTDFGTATPEAIGRKVQYVAPYNGSVTFKYAPSHGMLKGFSVNAGYTFVGATPTETPIAGDTLVTTPGTGRRVVTSSTGQWALKAPAYGLWSAGMRYTLSVKSKYSHTLALNVNNATNEQYFRAGTSGATRILRGENRAFYLTYTINHKGTSF